MKTIKVIIRDTNTLELQEDGNKGDVINLNELSVANVGVVTEAIKAAARREIEQEYAVKNENEIKAKLLEANLKSQEALQKIEIEKSQLNMTVESQKKRNRKIKSRNG